MAPLEFNRKKELSKVMAGSLGAGFMFLFFAQLLSNHLSAHPDDPRNRWLAIAPILLLVVLVSLAMRSVKRMDELERKMHTEAMAFAFLCSLPLVMGYGLLVTVDLIRPPVLWLTPAMVVCWNIGLLLSVERYR